MTHDEAKASAEWMLAHIEKEWHGSKPHSRFARELPVLLAMLVDFIEQDDAWWKAVAGFDTSKDAELRDANPELWAVMHGAETINCIPLEDVRKDPASLSVVWGYARTVARESAKLFNPDGTKKETK